jgi:glutathione S-transferase
VLELVAIDYSPWSEKARWALDHNGVPYKETPYLSMVGEFALRKRLGRWRGKVSLPLLFAGDEVINDSFAISTYVEETHGADRPLFPAEAHDEIKSWNEQSETGLAAGRALTSERVLASPAARREAMPPMPKLLVGPLSAPITKLGVAYLKRKYGFSGKPDDHRTALRATLENLKSTLADGRKYMLGEVFSYADICMAVTMQFVRPVTDEYIKLGPASRTAWTDETFSQEFSDLLTWRDGMYETHRRA